MIKLQVIGNLGYNAVIQSIQNAKVINFSVANNETYTDDKGEKRERTTWVQCSYWRREGQSVSVAEYLTSGTKVYVEGTPFLNEFKDRNGETKTSLSIRVDKLELLSQARNEPIPEIPQSNFEKEMVTTEDDLPF